MIIKFHGKTYFIEEPSRTAERLLHLNATLVTEWSRTCGIRVVTKNRISGQCGAVASIDTETFDWIKRQEGKHD